MPPGWFVLGSDHSAIATLSTLASQSEEGFAAEQIRLAETLDVLACRG